MLLDAHALQGQNRLKSTIAPLLRRPTRRLSLDQKDLRRLGVLLAEVPDHPQRASVGTLSDVPVSVVVALDALRGL